MKIKQITNHKTINNCLPVDCSLLVESESKKDGGMELLVLFC